MSRSRPVSLALGAILLLPFLLGGCVYLRLLTVKNQLRDFEKNFSVGGKPSWILEFNSPSLTAKDAIFLVGAPPLSVSTAAAGDVYDWEFEMVRSTPSAPTAMEHLGLRVHMRGNLLWKVEAPETFLLYFSRRVVEETLRQAKDAEVLQLKKTARATLRLPPEVDAELPSLERTRLLLGEPLEEQVQGEDLVLKYRYRIVEDQRGVPIVARLFFTPAGSLRRAVIRWESSTVDATFVRE